MAHVAALYRYPVKGFTPESCEALTVQADGRIRGDRVLGFRLRDAEGMPLEDGTPWWPKREMVCLQEYPGIARLRLRYDDEARRVSITVDGSVLVEAGLDDAGRVALAEAVGVYTRALPEAARVRREGALPLVLEGDGVSARFQDRPRGFITAHGRGSLLQLAEVLEDPELDETRFRSNIAVEGIEPWAELDWVGRVRIGEVEFSVESPVIRCLATHANPETGERDAEVLTTLTRTFGHERPTFGVLMLPAGEGGTIRLGDAVEVIG